VSSKLSQKDYGNAQEPLGVRYKTLDTEIQNPTHLQGSQARIETRRLLRPVPNVRQTV